MVGKQRDFDGLNVAQVRELAQNTEGQVVFTFKRRKLVLVLGLYQYDKMDIIS